MQSVPGQMLVDRDSIDLQVNPRILLHCPWHWSLTSETFWDLAVLTRFACLSTANQPGNPRKAFEGGRKGWGQETCMHAERAFLGQKGDCHTSPKLRHNVNAGIPMRIGTPCSDISPFFQNKSRFQWWQLKLHQLLNDSKGKSWVTILRHPKSKSWVKFSKSKGCYVLSHVLFTCKLILSDGNSKFTNFWTILKAKVGSLFWEKTWGLGNEIQQDQHGICSTLSYSHFVCRGDFAWRTRWLS